jgi:putative SOS response-associated peptidase YedK
VPRAGVVVLRAKGERPAIWHSFALNGSDARPLFAFPGIWRVYKGPLKRNGEPIELEVFAFMTTTPNELVATINHERMPVLLTGEEQFETWLQGSPRDAFALARRYPAEAMRIVQAGLEKEDLLAA